MSGHANGTSSVTEEPSQIKIYCGGSGNKCEYNSDSKIDLTNYSLVRAVSGLISVAAGGYTTYIGVAPSKTDGYIVNVSGFAMAEMLDLPYNNGLDISSVNGEYYIGVGRGGVVVTETLKELWLE